MAIAAELQEQVSTLTDLLGTEVCAEELPGIVRELNDDQVLSLLRRADALMRGAERVRIIASGVVAARSTRASGHGGLAQKLGHRNSTSLIQEMTGSTRSEAAKEIRVGEALLGDTSDGIRDDETQATPQATPPRAWHAPVSDALMAGLLSKDQHAAILRGLGEPPLPEPGSTEE